MKKKGFTSVSSPEVVFPADSAAGMLSKQESGSLKWWDEGEDEVSARFGGDAVDHFCQTIHFTSAAFQSPDEILPKRSQLDSVTPSSGHF